MRHSEALGVLLVGPDPAGILHTKPVLHRIAACAASEDGEEIIRDHSVATDHQLVGLLLYRVPRPGLCRHPITPSNCHGNKSVPFRPLFGAIAVVEAFLADIGRSIGLQRHSP